MTLHESGPQSVLPRTAPPRRASAAARPERDEPEFLKGLIEGMRCGILCIDDRGSLVHMNEHARRILDLEEAPSDVPLWDALGRYPVLVEVLLGSFEMSSLPNRAEIELELAAGTGVKRIGFTISLVRAEGGPVRGAAMFFKDLTQIEHTEEQERLRDRLAALGQMAASMAHEIRNPLAAIEVSCTLLGRRLGQDPRCLDLLERIASDVKRLNSTIHSSLEFVRPIAPALDFAEIGPLVDDAIGVAEGRCGRAGIAIVRRYERDLPPFLMDRSLLRQVFVNLVVNAMESIPGDGTVRVEIERVEPTEASIPYRREASRDPWSDVRHYAVVRVADTGSGIREEDRDRIFYPFFTTKKQGSGVGLATVRKIVGSHRGVVDVESTLGVGTQFIVRLPMALQPVEV